MALSTWKFEYTVAKFKNVIFSLIETSGMSLFMLFAFPKSLFISQDR